MQALHVHAGPRARRHLLDAGLSAREVRIVPAAVGGPKGARAQPLGSLRLWALLARLAENRASARAAVDALPLL
jgi:hypothetical protein